MPQRSAAIFGELCEMVEILLLLIVGHVTRVWLIPSNEIATSLNEIWNERINEIYTVSYLLYEFKILIKMLKLFYGTIRSYRILY